MTPAGAPARPVGDDRRPVPTASLVPDPTRSARERILAALAACVREQGYRTTTVADVVAQARTSRRTFYAHFADRDACFLALFDAMNDRLLERIARAAGGEGSWEERMDAGLAAYLGAMAAEPEITRSCILELPALGEEGTLRARAIVERTASVLEALTAEAAAHDPRVRALGHEAAVVIAGGFRELTVSTLEQGRDLTELRALAGDLLRRLTTSAR